MTDYLEQSITGKTWVRSDGVTISNPYGGAPECRFSKERITELSDGTKVNTQLPPVSDQFLNPAEQFNLLHPLTGDVVGTATYQEVYVMLYSLFMHVEQKA
jgi:hypothetical protein